MCVDLESTTELLWTSQLRAPEASGWLVPSRITDAEDNPLTESEGSPSPTLVDRARNLFTFLAEAQRLRVKPVLDVETYTADGQVLWIHKLPEHPAIELGVDEFQLTVRRLPPNHPPEPPDGLAQWVAGDIDDPNADVAVRAKLPPAPGEFAPTELTSQAGTDRQALEEWLASWTGWADTERRDRPVRRLYSELFTLQAEYANRPDELELVGCSGLLTWRPPGGAPVIRRHLLSQPVAAEFDAEEGSVTLRPDFAAECRLEINDFLSPTELHDPAGLEHLREDLRQIETHALDQDAVTSTLRQLAHGINSSASYTTEPEPPMAGPDIIVAWAPAIVLRRRSKQDWVGVFEQIASQIDETEEVPEGVASLVDPSYQPAGDFDWSDGHGALVDVDDTSFLPLPVNDKQEQVIRQASRSPHVLVQGPPGTGKTHTAAALISHLLAMGKRVLVTAHTDRALYEVRDKLPASVRELAVSVVGTSRDDMAELRSAVQRLSAESAGYNPTSISAQEARLLAAIEGLRRERANSYRELVEAREHEVRLHRRSRYEGTLAQITRQNQAHRADHEWLLEHAPDIQAIDPPITNSELLELLGLLRDRDLAADETEAQQRRPELNALATADHFLGLVDAEREAHDAAESLADSRTHPLYPPLRVLAAADRADLRHGLQGVDRDMQQLAGRREPWLTQALAEIRSGKTTPWLDRSRNIEGLIGRVTALLEGVGPATQVVVAGERQHFVPKVEALQGFVASGNSVRANHDGTPKIGALAPRVLRQCRDVFDQVLVNGSPPVTAAALQQLHDWLEADRALDALDQAWPVGTSIPVEDTLIERNAWHRGEHEILVKLLQLANELDGQAAKLLRLNLPAIDWNDPAAIHSLVGVLDAADADSLHEDSRRPLIELHTQLETMGRWADAAPVVERLRNAVAEFDHDAYAAAIARLERLDQVTILADRRDQLADTLNACVPRLLSAVQDNHEDPSWAGKLRRFEEAWTWAEVGEWVRAQDSVDINLIQQKLHSAEDRLRTQIEELAATRAWAHAAAPSRIGPEARAELQLYALLVKKLGMGTGKDAAAQRAEIRRSLDRCRASVPAWIMPLNRVVQQFDIQPNVFDVVIVDEASQAGLEASFLQYLAPKVVVIGDDLQVSPSAVGVDRNQLRSLARQYLAGDRFVAAWRNPTVSLFDLARMRFGAPITLTEHRRCVPEIIGFSNRIAYTPNNVQLQPVRMFGGDRLQPVVPVYIEDGVRTGGANALNKAEADAIVDQIEKCLADPRYDTKTIGVISLLGKAQAKYLEAQLLDRIDPDEWAARDLRCGDAADFQGSERDVIFLSMVAATGPESPRLQALTADTYLQRYNVAGSRAKDQMWIFHSVRLQELGNPDDMRFQLLDYAYGVRSRENHDDDRVLTQLVSEDVRQAPFDSLFEQRVCNRLIEAGYTVIPQFESTGYRIDLVAVGSSTRVAVECDGDHWHGPDRYRVDLARQRDLERCGWVFHRIRESAFYADPGEEIRRLRQTLFDQGIRSSGEEEAAAPEPSHLSFSDVVTEAEPVAAIESSAAPAAVTEFAPGAPRRTGDTGELPQVYDGERTEALSPMPDPEGTKQHQASALPTTTPSRGDEPPTVDASGSHELEAGDADLDLERAIESTKAQPHL